MNVRDRIIERVKSVNINQAGIVKLTGASKGTVNQWVSGKIEPSKKFDKQLARALLTTTDYINYGIKPEDNQDAGSRIESANLWNGSAKITQEEVEVFYYMDINLAVGATISSEVCGGDLKLRFSVATLNQCGVKPDQAVCVKVHGNSMEPRIFEGDMVGVNKGDSNISDGKVYVINHDGLLRIKRLYNMPGGAIRINSYNSIEHPDEIISSEQRHLIKLIGRVFWFSSTSN